MDKSHKNQSKTRPKKQGCFQSMNKPDTHFKSDYLFIFSLVYNVTQTTLEKT